MDQQKKPKIALSYLKLILRNLESTKMQHNIEEDPQIEDVNESEETIDDVDVQLFSDSCDWKNFKGKHLIHFASEMGKLNIVQKLLKDGVDIETKDENGWTPLICAASKGHLNVVKYLVSKNAQIEVLDKEGFDAIKRAEEKFYYKDNQKVMKYLGSRPLPTNENHFS